MITTRTTAGQAMQITKAKQLAKRYGVVHCVVEMDSADGREMRVVRESYILQEEFAAFDGVILFAVHSDGTVE